MQVYYLLNLRIIKYKSKIQKDINLELKRHIYVIAPKCYPANGSPLLTCKDLDYNGGMDKEKFLDIDVKSHCKAYIKTKCVEIGKWTWNIAISCKDYTDKEYIDGAEEFESKK